MLNQFKEFWNKQVDLVRVHGFKMVLRKIHTILLLPIVGIVAGIIYFLRPFVIIRIGSIGSFNIGESDDALWYLYEVRSGTFSNRYYDVFYKDTYVRVCNKEWFKLLKKKMRFVSYDKFFYLLHKIMGRLKIFREHIIIYGHPPTNEVLAKVFLDHSPLLELAGAQEKMGAAFLNSVGIERNPFICFFSRDTAYRRAENISYHDHRNTSIRNYVSAVEKILERNDYYAFRMGSAVDEKVKTDQKRIVDYANGNLRSELLDIYLFSKCKYFLTSDSGINVIAETFKRPLIYTNFVTIGLLPTFHHYGLIIMKKWYSKKEKKLLTFSEILKVANPYINTGINDYLKKSGIELIDNSVEEIMDVVDEMEKRIDCSWVSTEEDEKLQNRFWDLYGRQWLRTPTLRIGAKFLRENQQLLYESHLIRAH